MVSWCEAPKTIWWVCGDSGVSWHVRQDIILHVESSKVRFLLDDTRIMGSIASDWVVQVHEPKIRLEKRNEGLLLFVGWVGLLLLTQADTDSHHSTRSKRRTVLATEPSKKYFCARIRSHYRNYLWTNYSMSGTQTHYPTLKKNASNSKSVGTFFKKDFSSAKFMSCWIWESFQKLLNNEYKQRPAAGAAWFCKFKRLNWKIQRSAAGAAWFCKLKRLDWKILRPAAGAASFEWWDLDEWWVFKNLNPLMKFI